MVILSQDGDSMVITNHKLSQEKLINNAVLMAVTEAHIWKAHLIEEWITVKQLAQKLNIIYKRLKLLSLSSTI